MTSLGADRVIDYTREDFADGTCRYDLILDIGGTVHGVIAGAWSTVDGRRRRTCRLTGEGLRRLHADRSNWHGFAAAITALLERRPWPATS